MNHRERAEGGQRQVRPNTFILYNGECGFHKGRMQPDDLVREVIRLMDRSINARQTATSYEHFTRPTLLANRRRLFLDP